ncbi:uncharacterized protein LOC124896000 isoform X2 [Capsicum annuum]|nr:uncharacterized protein LOC124896000 isoform X2 [Capsicum annuum]
MPPPAHQFQPFSPHTSLHSSSSSVPSTSSTPSLFGLRIEGASTSTSPFIDSDTASNATAATSQFPKFKEVVEYEDNDRLIISPDGGNGFIPASSGGHMTIEAIKPFYTQPWGSWNEIKNNVRVLMWNQFVTKCAWNSCYENEIQRIFKFKAALRIKEHFYEARRSLKKPGWLNADVWVKFLEKWDTLEFRARREWTKANRASQMGDSLHTGGSMSFATHRRRLEYENGGKKHPFLEVYEETHRKKNKDGTRGDWVELRARIAYEEFQENLEEWRKTQPTSEDGTMVQPSSAELNNMWTTVIGGPKNGRTYGTGDLQSSSTPSLFPSSSSTLQTMEEMEAMKKQIVELTQKCAANDARFAKFDKLEELVKKHMPQIFRDEEDNESDDN